MNTRPDAPHKNRVVWLKRFSFASLLLERLSLALWRTVFWTLGCAALLLFEIPQNLASWAPFATLIIALFGVFIFLVRDLRQLSWPRARDVIQRIERHNGIAHRPLSALSDTPVHSDENNLLWRKEQRRKRTLLNALTPAPPRAFIATKDPRGIRFLVIIAIICGTVIAGPNWSTRIKDGLFPESFLIDLLPESQPASIWITPPEYTQMPRILPDAEQARLSIPQGSALKVIVPKRITHYLSPPHVAFGEKRHNMTLSDENAYTLEIEIPNGAKNLHLSLGLLNRFSWPYDYITDAPPTLSVADTPQILPDGSIQFAVDVMDDYGVTLLDMRMTLDPLVEYFPVGWPIEEQRSILSSPGAKLKTAPVYDLTAHPWAGLPAVFTFRPIWT